MSKITDIVSEIARPVVERHGCSLWDVEYLKEAGGWFLRIYIDHPDLVTIDMCEAVSKEIDPLLDERDPIPDSYTFEVSSAGAERPLKRPSDFALFMGHKVEVKLYQNKNGRKEQLGILRGYDAGAVTLEMGGENVRFEKGEIANVRLRIS